MKLLEKVYTTSINAYGLGLKLASHFNPKAKEWIEGRLNWKIELAKSSKTLKGCIWMHCSSLGEFEQGRSMLEELKRAYPSKPILLSFFSPSGYNIRKDYPQAAKVIYLALDTEENANFFIQQAQPSLAIFVKYDLWHFHLKALKNNSVPTILIAGVFKPHHYYFKPFAEKLFMQKLSSLKRIYVQDIESKTLLLNKGYKSVIQSGDTRFDRVIQIKEKAKAIPQISKFKKQSKLLVLGSSWPEDEVLMAKWFSTINSPNEWKIVIAPHEIDENHLSAIEALFQNKTVRFSKLINEPETNEKILIIDNIGMLSSIYQYATVSFIGGGFGKGIHNTLEAAVYGKPIFFGPNNKQFEEALELTKLEIAKSISTSEEFTISIKEFEASSKLKQIIANRSQEFFSEHKGATNRIMEDLATYWP